MPNRVSIIVPFRDKMDLTNECLRTLADALEPDERNLVDLVLVDNRSTAAELARLVVPPVFKERRVTADCDFNFQNLINRGAAAGDGDFLLLLNNDIVFVPESKGFLTRMLAVAKRRDVGAVGPLLLYPDGSIQHGGVVVGMYTYAEHLYRLWSPAQANLFPFTPYDRDRYVSAVTAAFLLVERKKYDQIRGMDERFIVCGGDVDLCIRLHEAGYKNVYMGSERFVHLESKSRDTSKIPEADFVESRRSYGAFLKAHGGRDPYYPAPLSLEPKAPEVPGPPPKETPPQRRLKHRIKQELKRLRAFYRDVRGRMQTEPLEMIIAAKLVKIRQRWASRAKVVTSSYPTEARSARLVLMHPLTCHLEYPVVRRPRLNVLLPHYNDVGVFAGIITACTVGAKVKLKHPGIDLRFVFVDGVGKLDALRRDLKTTLGAEAVDRLEFQSMEVYARGTVSFNVHADDHFLATAWWSCYQARDALRVAAPERPFVYLIQDYECGFYPWGDWYAHCLATYAMNYVPIFNTGILRDFFLERKLVTAERAALGAAFDPAVSRHLYNVPRPRKKPGEKRRLFFYGREAITRNLFPIGINGLAQAIEEGIFDPAEWEFVSAGQPHAPVHLAKGAHLKSVGKLTLQNYAKLLSETEIGLSLMLSPHPSYPPLEIAAAGAFSVTNTFANKDLARLSPNIISCAPSIEGVVSGLAVAVARLKTETLDAPRPLALPDNWDEALDPIADALYGLMRS